MKPKILIIHANGSNRDRDVAWACELAGGQADIVHINQIASGDFQMRDYQMLVLPGGFSYGDDLGAGKLWALALRHRLADDLAAFADAGRPILGICNGFQALVKSGLLPGLGSKSDKGNSTLTQTATLTRNESAQFECRWVYLEPELNSACIFTKGLDAPIYCPVAHGEGRFIAQDASTLATIESKAMVALRYAVPSGMVTQAGVGYPWNPNGSQANIAGICNVQGNVFGLMPHPENHIIAEHHPQFHRGIHGLMGLALFENGVQYAMEL